MHFIYFLLHYHTTAFSLTVYIKLLNRKILFDMNTCHLKIAISLKQVNILTNQKRIMIILATGTITWLFLV